MALRKSFAVVLFVVISSLAAVKTASAYQSSQAPDLTSLSDADLKAVTIRFERTLCYGSCPAYTVTIHGDGRVEYAGKQYVKTTGNQKGRIEPAAIKALVAEFARAKFLALPDYSEEKCACRRCTDMPSAVTEISVGGVTHRVDHYYGCGCAPKALFELESAIDKAVNSEQWTGDVSKQGPFGTTCFG
jgi:hypothetical protein